MITRIPCRPIAMSFGAWVLCTAAALSCFAPGCGHNGTGPGGTDGSTATDLRGAPNGDGGARDLSFDGFMLAGPHIVISPAGSGSGTVVSTPAGISCGTTCQAAFTQGAAVQLVATPSNDSTFAGWSGACTGTGPCDVTVTGTVAVTATFVLNADLIPLTVVRSGSGSAAVVSTPAGMNCGPTCTYGYPSGTKVTLSIQTAGDSYFAGWSGPCAGVGPCTLTLTQPTTVSALFAPRICPAAHFCWDNQFPQGNALNGTIGFAANDVWAVGDVGTMMHWNGVGWTPVTSGVQGNMSAVWGTSGTNLWMASQIGTVYNWNGTSIKSYSGLTIKDLFTVWGSSANDVWVGGERGTLLHWNGTGFSMQSMLTLETVESIWGSGQSNVWAVCSNGALEHYNGTAWSLQPKLGTQNFYAVWGSGPSDVYAAGAVGTLYHYNGTAWSAVKLGTTNDLVAIWGSASNNVWVYPSPGGTVYHYDGNTWQAVATGTALRLGSAWGSSASDTWAVGGSGALAHYNGTTWAPLYPGPIGDLNDAWGNSATDIWAVGAAGTIGHYDGFFWKTVPSGTTTNLYAVWASGPGNIWAAGDSGTVVHYNGTSFAAVSGAASTHNLKSIAGSSANDVFIVGDQGVLHWDGTALTTHDLGTGTNLGLARVISTGPGAAWAGQGLLVHITGGTHTFLNLTYPHVITGMWSSGGADFWLSYDNGAIDHFDGTSTFTTAVPSGLTTSVSLWGSGSSMTTNDIWVVGTAGTLAHYDGTSFTSFATGFTTNFFSVWGTGPANTWLTGQNGVVLRYKP